MRCLSVVDFHETAATGPMGLTVQPKEKRSVVARPRFTAFLDASAANLRSAVKCRRFGPVNTLSRTKFTI